MGYGSLGGMAASSLSRAISWFTGSVVNNFFFFFFLPFLAKRFGPAARLAVSAPSSALTCGYGY